MDKRRRSPGTGFPRLLRGRRQPLAGSDEEAVRIGSVMFDALYSALGGAARR